MMLVAESHQAGTARIPSTSEPNPNQTSPRLITMSQTCANLQMGQNTSILSSAKPQHSSLTRVAVVVNHRGMQSLSPCTKPTKTMNRFPGKPLKQGSDREISSYQATSLDFTVATPRTKRCDQRCGSNATSAHYNDSTNTRQWS